MPRNHNLVNDLDKKRLERVGRFCAIIGAAWFSFGAYYVFLGTWFTVSICAIETLAAVFAVYLANRYEGSRLYVANGYLLFSVIGVIVESLGSGLGASTTPLFLCVVGLMAAHQTGIRSAARWTLAIIFVQLMIYLVLDPADFPIYRQGTQMESFLVAVAVTLIIYALSHQAEWSFDRYAKQYIAASDELREQAQSLRLAERVAEVGHWRWDAQTNQLRLSKEAAKICGFESAVEGIYQESDFLECLQPNSRKQLADALGICRRVRHNFALNLELRPGNATQFARYIGFSEVNAKHNVTHIFGVVKDETASNRTQAELNQKAKELHQLAKFDQLTGLANRRTFTEQLADCAKDCDAREGRMALLMIDLDGFKEVNDTLGHAAGDVVLREVAKRLNKVIKDTDVSGSVARLGGDEFTVILSDIKDPRDIDTVADAISWQLGLSYSLNQKEVKLAASVGAAIYPTDTADLTELLSYADTAMYEAKVERVGMKAYDPTMTEKILKQHGIESRLRGALKQNEFFLDYQPLLNSDRKACGVEALLRWKCDGKIVSPGIFIPHLESSHAILDVGRWTLFQACNQGREWVDQGLPLRISVNTSAVQFRHHDFIRDVREALAATNFPPDLLDIEVTESVVVGEMRSAGRTIRQLKEIGVHLSIDDFGTGYSSLSYLKHLPFDRLKIDRAFVKDHPETDDGTLAKTIIVLGHSLDMHVVAEGVETEAQFDFLRENDCDEFQGFLFSRPVSPEKLTRELESSSFAPIQFDLTTPKQTGLILPE